MIPPSQHLRPVQQSFLTSPQTTFTVVSLVDLWVDLVLLCNTTDPRHALPHSLLQDKAEEKERGGWNLPTCEQFHTDADPNAAVANISSYYRGAFASHWRKYYVSQAWAGSCAPLPFTLARYTIFALYLQITGGALTSASGLGVQHLSKRTSFSLPAKFPTSMGRSGIGTCAILIANRPYGRRIVVIIRRTSLL